MGLEGSSLTPPAPEGGASTEVLKAILQELLSRKSVLEESMPQLKEAEIKLSRELEALEAPHRLGMNYAPANVQEEYKLTQLRLNDAVRASIEAAAEKNEIEVRINEIENRMAS